jgi:hypothetical protein
MAPFFPPSIQASVVELGRVICAKPDRKTTHLCNSDQQCINQANNPLMHMKTFLTQFHLLIMKEKKEKLKLTAKQAHYVFPHQTPPE